MSARFQIYSTATEGDIRVYLTYTSPICPPEEVREPSPPARALAVNGRFLQVQEECESPALRDIMGLWIELGQWVREEQFGWRNGLS